jgi:hypothetical protein
LSIFDWELEVRLHMCTLEVRLHVCTLEVRLHVCTLEVRLHMCTLEVRLHMCTALTVSAKFCLVRDVPEEGHVEAETCRRHIVKWEMFVSC